MDFSNNYNALGKILVQKLRDENYEYYLQMKEQAQSKTSEEYYNEPRNTNLDNVTQSLMDERFDLLNSLESKHIKTLDRLILNILDSTAFNMLREVEENLHEDKSLGLSINGEPVETLQMELLSGTLFGEYFLWLEKNSKHGEFQQ